MTGVPNDAPSNVTVNGVQLMWSEVVEQERQRASRVEAFQSLMSDLDRCEHGRHRRDVCSYCPDGGGNRLLSPGQRIGTTLSGYPIIVPEHTQFAKAEDWIGPRVLDRRA